MNSPEYALPGEFLGVVEEYAGGPDVTFEDADGKVYASVAGVRVSDAAARSVSVRARKLSRPLRAGDLVYARVVELYESMARLEFAAVPSKHARPAGQGSAFMRISEMDRGYVERLRDAVCTGDFVRARVLDIKPLGIYLTMKESDLGVVRAYCTKDRSPMQSMGRTFLCPTCGRREGRKTPQPK